jgi:hypothetical protein
MPIKPIGTNIPNLSMQEAPPTETEEQEVTPPTLPPVEPNEFYPGYNKELNEYGTRVYKSQEDIRTITEKRKSFKLPIQSARINLVVNNPDMQESMDKLKVEFQQYQSDMNSSLTALNSDEWRYSIIATLPMLMITNGIAGTGVESADYVSRLFPNKDMNQSDMDWLQSTWDKLSYLKPSLPTNVDIAEAKRKLIEVVAEQTKLPLTTISGKTVEELAKYFTSDPRAKLPEGMTAKEFNDVLGYMSIPDEDRLSIADFISANMIQWKTESNFIELTRQGVLEATDPNMLPTEFLKMLMIVPMAATTELLDKVWDYTVRPAVAASVIATHRIIESTFPDFAKNTYAEQLEQKYVQNTEDGTANWAALSDAYNDWEAPGPWKGQAYKMLAETAFDPTTWVGLGVYAKLVDRGAITLLSLIGKGDKIVIPANTFFSNNMGTRVGAKLLSIENGIQYAMDTPFRWIGKGIAKIPRTTTQLSKDFARSTSQIFNAVTLRSNKMLTSAANMTLVDIDSTVKLAKDTLFKANEGGSMYSVLAKRMAEFEYLTDKTAKEMFGKMADGVDFDIKRLADINGDLIDLAEGSFTDKLIANNLLSRLGKEATDPELLKEMTEVVQKFKQTLLDNIDSMTAGKTVKDRLINMFDTLKNIRYSNLNHPVSQYWNIAGRKVGWISRNSDAILHSAPLVNLEKYTTMPYARMQLLFVNFGPWNYVDNAFRSFFGGGRLVVPGDYTGLLDMEVKYGSSLKYPVEASWIERRHREASATFGIAAGNREKSLFDKGIPLVTKDLYNSKGEIIGKSITYRGQTYTVSSFDGWNRIWDDQTDIQRYLNMEINADKQLAKLAPEQVKELTDIMSDLAPDLKAIKSFEPGDIPGLDRRHFSYAASSPEMFRTLHNITTTQLKRNVIVKKLAQSLKANANIPSGVKQYIRDSITDGSLFRDLSKSKANVVAMARDQTIASLQIQEELLKKQVERFIGQGAPLNISEFRNDIANVTNVFTAVRDRMHEYRATVELRKAALPLGKERDTFEEGSAKVLSNFIKTSSDQLTAFIDQLKKNAIGLEPAVQSELNAFGTVYLKKVKLNADLREKLLKLETKIPATPPKKRDDRFWRQLGTEKSKIWSEHEAASYGIDSEMLIAQRNFMDTIGEKTYIPQAIDPVQKGKLTVHNLAQLFGATGDESVSRLLTTVTSQVIVRPRQSFIVYVRDQANAYARARLGTGKTALDIQYTDEAIGALYDDLWSRLGIAKSAVQTDTIQLQEIDNVFKEIDGLYAGVKVPESDVLKYKDYVNKFADRLEQTSMYAPIKDVGLSEGLGTQANIDLQNRLTELATNVQVPGDGNLRSQVDKWFHQTDNEALQNIGKGAMANKQYLDQIHKILREKYPSGKIRIFRGSGASKSYARDPFGREFLNVTSDKKVAQDFESTWSAYDPDNKIALEFDRDNYITSFSGSPKPDNYQSVIDDFNSKIAAASKSEYPISGRKTQVNDVVINVDDVVSIGSVTESELIIPSSILKDRISNPLTMPRTGQEAWESTKDQAMKQGLEQHYLDFPDYTQQNFIDESMKQIFPFWTYETFRWRWMPRTFLRTPGTFTTMARWNENTDNGYVPIPGTDWDLNLLRGTTMMGGLRSFYSKDSPAFYNRYPGLEMFEKLGRYGFFPGLPVQGAMTVFGAYGRKNWGELLPPWVTTPMAALRQLSPNNLGPIIDEIFPESYSDYRTSMILASQGYDANALWKKKYKGETMTPQEQKLWNSAAASANGIRRVFEEQIGLMRLRTDEYNKFKENWKLAIQDVTGVSPQVQDQIDKMYPVTGKRFADYYPLDVLQQKLLYTYEEYRNWQGLATPMYPSSWTNMEIKISDYYDEVEAINQQFRHSTQYNDAGKVESYSEDDIDEQFRTGVINGSQWQSAISEIEANRYKSIEALQQSEAYSGIPISYEDRAAWMEEKGEIVPTLSPSQELLYYYYELKPESKWNGETGKYEPDWDTYYAYVDNLLASMEPAYRDRLLQRIQFDWSDMRKLYWKVSRDFIQPYNQVQDVIISTYKENEQYWIRAYSRADTTEQNRIEKFYMENGEFLMTDYNKKLSNAHESMRLVDPELDSWLNFFGKVKSFKTPEAEQKYNELKNKYLSDSAE